MRRVSVWAGAISQNDKRAGKINDGIPRRKIYVGRCSSPGAGPERTANKEDEADNGYGESGGNHGDVRNAGNRGSNNHVLPISLRR